DRRRGSAERRPTKSIASKFGRVRLCRAACDFAQLPYVNWRDKIPAMENGTPQLVARDLRRSFRMGPRRIEVLRGISMEVQRSEAVFLVGASRAGKTTRPYTLAGLERAEGGPVGFEGPRHSTGR